MNASEFESYKWSVELEFDGIAECIEKIATSIDEAGNDAADRFAEMFKTGFYEDNIPAFEESRYSMWLANNRLPDLAYRGFFVAIWSVFEIEMITLAKTYAARTMNDEKAREKEQKFLTDVVKVEAFWLKNKVNMPPTWLDFDDIREVRNMVVHYNGDIRLAKGDLDENDKKLNKRKERVRKFISNRINSNVVNLCCPMNEIDVTQGFCRELCDRCKGFLAAMAEQIMIKLNSKS